MKTKPASLALMIVCALFATASSVQAQTDTTSKTDFDAAIHLESFDVVWSTIKKTHWDPECVGESWDEAREKYRPMVEDAKDVDEVRETINELLGTLEQSHFGIIGESAYDEYEEEQSGGDDKKSRSGDGTAGLEVRLVEDRLVVTRVFEGYPAAEAGVQTGWEVKLIGSRTADQILKGAKVVADVSVVRHNTGVGLVCDSRCSGDIGEKLAFAFVDHNKDVILKYLELVEAPGELETFGNLPAIQVKFESRDIDGVGYIAFNSFIGGPRLNKEYQKAIKEYRESKGLIIDLRGNRGGMVLLVSAMCGWLAKERVAIGKMTATGGNTMNLMLNPRGKKYRYTKPVAILTDECSISAAEIMAGGIKDLDLGRVFGSTTAGLSLPSTVVRLPNGDGFQYALSAYHSASGESIEGVGVEPNVKIELTRELLSKDNDPVLSAAKKWINEQQDDQ